MLSHLLPESLYLHSTKENLFEHLLCANGGDSKTHKEPCPKSDHPAVGSAKVWGKDHLCWVSSYYDLLPLWTVFVQGGDPEAWVGKAHDLEPEALGWNQG